MTRRALSAMAVLALVSFAVGLAWLASDTESEESVSAPVHRSITPASAGEAAPAFAVETRSERPAVDHSPAPKPFSIRGLVVDPQGLPVARAVVSLRRPADCPTMPEISRVLTDEQGQCELSSARGMSVVALMDGVGISEPVTIDKSPPGPDSTVTLTLQPRCLVTIELPDIEASERTSLRVVGEMLRQPPIEAPFCTAESLQGPHWHLWCGPPCAGVILAMRADCAIAGKTFTEKVGTLVDCEVPEIDDFAVVSAAERIGGPDVPVVSLALTSESGIRSDFNQSQQLQLIRGINEPGRYLMAARADDCMLSSTVEFEVSDECRVAYTSVEFLVGVAIRGRAVWPSGEAASGLRVTVKPDPDRSPRDNPWPESMVRSARTDADGQFEFPCVALDKKYRVRFTCLAGTERVYSFGDVRPGAPPEDYVLADESLCTQPVIAGRVIDATTGLPVTEFATRIQVISGWNLVSGHWKSAVNWDDGTGEFHYDDVDPSALYHLQVLSGYRGRGEWATRLDVGPLIPGQGSCDLDIVIGSGTSVVVTVVDDFGRPVEGARAYLRDAGYLDTGQVDMRSLSQFTDANGRVGWANVVPGWYWAIASTTASAWGGKLVCVGPAEPIDASFSVSARGLGSISLTFPPASLSKRATEGPLRFDLHRAVGDPWLGPHVLQTTVWDPNESGIYRVSDLIPGDYFAMFWVGTSYVGHAHVAVLPDGVAELRFE